MVLKHLQGAAWALCLAFACGAAAQGPPVPPGGEEPNYYDRDRDGVPDNQDKCPDEKGPASNNGCVETIVVIGVGFVVCPGGMVVAVTQDCPGYGHFRPAMWSTDTGIVNGDNGWTPSSRARWTPNVRAVPAG